MTRKTQKVYVAMSGGVDSSVAAGLLKAKGFNVTGVFMKPWSPPNTPCIWKKEREDAMRAAAVLDIPLLTWDFSKEYKKSVADYMIKEYSLGRTPNPDVMCNKEIKFGLFYKKAIAEGADKIATGHYVRCFKKGENYAIYEGKDKNKDQSYFLWALNPKILSKCLFPIGEIKKTEVRRLARKMGLPNYAKKDSQGVCFIGPLDMKNFLSSNIKPRAGKILDSKGDTIGTHDGVYYYTLGQRHGLNISIGSGPYYVIDKDIRKNIIYVGKERELLKNKASITKSNWFSGKKINMDVRIRYRAKKEPVTLQKNVVMFKNPVRAITSGQSAVFYVKERLVGGAIIK
jgi:tRNA-specific 2-thiouridylase